MCGNRLLVCLALAAGVLLAAGRAFATSVVPLELDGTVYANAALDSDEGWNSAFACYGEWVYDPIEGSTYFIECLAEIELTSGDWGAALAPHVEGGNAGTSSPASLVIGTSDGLPAGTPLLLMLSPTVHEWSTNGIWELTLTRAGDEILVQDEPAEAAVSVLAGETLLLDFFISGGSCVQGPGRSLTLDMYTVVAEPEALVLVAAAGLALSLRRRTK